MSTRDVPGAADAPQDRYANYAFSADASAAGSGFLRMSKKSRAMPMQIAESATLKAGQ